jgi:hypothetical protein
MRGRERFDPLFAAEETGKSLIAHHSTVHGSGTESFLHTGQPVAANVPQGNVRGSFRSRSTTNLTKRPNRVVISRILIPDAANGKAVSLAGVVTAHVGAGAAQ